MKDRVKVISKKKVAGDELLSFYKVNLQLPTGKIRTHFNVERIPAVAVFPVAENGDIFLISQYRYIFNKVMLESVAGKVDKGESTLSCAKRELQEEAGIVASHWKELAEVDLAASYIKARISIFLARGLTLGKQKLQEDESISLVKISLNNAVQKVLNGEITTASSIIGILWLYHLQKEKKL